MDTKVLRITQQAPKLDALDRWLQQFACRKCSSFSLTDYNCVKRLELHKQSQPHICIEACIGFDRLTT
jgi:hypothetical protein